MYPETNPTVVTKAPSSRLESIASYVFLATVILAPLVFWPTQYIAFDLVKTIVIVLGSLISAILFAVIGIREKKLALPSKNIFWTSILIGISLIISSLSSINAANSLFGQGFELGTTGFILSLFVSAFAAFSIVSRKPEKALVLYVGLAVSFLILFVIQALRFVFGGDFATLGILGSLTSTILGSWFNLGIFSVVVALISFIGFLTLPLSRAMKFAYGLMVVVGLVLAFIVNAPFVWPVTALVLFGLTWHLSTSKQISGSIFKKIAWVPAIAFIVLAFITWQADKITDPVSVKMYGGYSEISLPWQMTLDVTAASIKNSPLLGVGPNNFSRAFMVYKPAIINSTDAWSLEFSNGLSSIATYITTQGAVGAILWALLLIFYGILGVKALKRLPEDRSERFLILSSFTGSVFLWMIMLIYVPGHVIMFITFVLTGIFLGAIRAYGLTREYSYEPALGTKSYRLMPTVLSICIILGSVWGLMYVKKTIALGYFGGGIKILSSEKPDPVKADSKFKTALSIDSSDVFMRGRVEAALMQVNLLMADLNKSTTASSSQAIVEKMVETVNVALGYSEKAIALDNTNYYNHLSEARVSETAINLKMDKAYENAIKAYKNAITLNPYNPALYLSLAKLHASQGKYDESLQSIGTSLSVKNNYLDAIFLLSQVNAAKGNLPDAITAAKVAIEINPNNAILQFQLGLLEFNNKNYQASADALNKAVEIQKDYANAKYFLGLAYARLGKSSDAIDQFAELAITNPDNQEITLILQNLKSGKAIFADAPVAPAPEKRSSLPVKEKR